MGGNSQNEYKSKMLAHPKVNFHSIFNIWGDLIAAQLKSSSSAILWAFYIQVWAQDGCN